jgi:hypothetical protein
MKTVFAISNGKPKRFDLIDGESLPDGSTAITPAAFVSELNKMLSTDVPTFQATASPDAVTAAKYQARKK